MIQFRLIKPIDILFLRGNKLFGDAGAHGESEMPPWPSVFSGAMASRILVDQKRLLEISKKSNDSDKILAEVAGENFSCTFLGLSDQESTFLPVPNDMVIEKNDDNNQQKEYSVSYTIPKDLNLFIDKNLKTSYPKQLPMIPILQSSQRRKPVSGFWLNLKAWEKYLQDETGWENQFSSFFKDSGQLWKLEQRLGIGRDFFTKTAAEGKIYTSEAIAFNPKTSFIAGYLGKNIPDSGLLRLGGDGRGAEISIPKKSLVPKNLGIPNKNWNYFKMIFITPGIFSTGWLPLGCKIYNNEIIFEYQGFKARLLSASIKRYNVVSGWDIAKHRPKPGQKVIPVGSVYWFEVLEGDIQELQAIWEKGLYILNEQNSQGDPKFQESYHYRKREGFGRVWFGAWNKKEQ